jgi:hypothetical protein
VRTSRRFWAPEALLLRGAQGGGHLLPRRRGPRGSDAFADELLSVTARPPADHRPVVVRTGRTYDVDSPRPPEEHASGDACEREQHDEEELAQRDQEWDTYEDQEQDHRDGKKESEDSLGDIGSAARVGKIA